MNVKTENVANSILFSCVGIEMVYQRIKIKGPVMILRQ